MLGKDATNWRVEEKALFIKLKIKEKMADVKCLRHVTCLEYDLESLLETLVKNWTNVETVCFLERKKGC